MATVQPSVCALPTGPPVAGAVGQAVCPIYHVPGQGRLTGGYRRSQDQGGGTAAGGEVYALSWPCTDRIGNQPSKALYG